MEECKIENMYDLDQTIGADLFSGKTYPWEVLPEIGDFIRKLGPTLDSEKFDKINYDIWIAKSVSLPYFGEGENRVLSCTLKGPLIIDENTEVRPGAFIRGNVIVGKDCVVGNSTEIKNSVLFNHVQVPHYNYVGDSVLGYYSHMGAGSITSNVKSDKTLVVVNDKNENEKIETGLKKFGAMLGNHVEIGCNTVLNPGTVVCPDTNVYPVSCVRGVIPAHSIYKTKDSVIRKKN
jgi:NDP-sugar pyrophosphorylase family protein